MDLPSLSGVCRPGHMDIAYPKCLLLAAALSFMLANPALELEEHFYLIFSNALDSMSLS